uniref:Uncharacterized protein n=1 Tax=Parascaris equorum TaxID=6256 RepID=A0A914SGT2_PAREQ
MGELADLALKASEDLMMQQAEEWGLNDYKQPKSVQPKDGGKFQKAGDFERHYTSAARGEASSGENFESSDGTRIAQERKVDLKVEDQHNLNEEIDRGT